MNKEMNFKYEAPSSNSAILGTLVGPCADIMNPTRNDRFYSEALWENTFENDIVKEYFENGGIPGEFGHPTDRSETLPEKIAIMMKEPPKKEKGLLMGRWDILNTPNGRILKTLIDYGYKVGISSRGTGDVYEDLDGKEQVDETTYDFQAFDVVLLPAVKAARLTPVTESITKTFKQALTESLNKASEEDRKIMEETLENLNIDYTPSKEDDNIEVESDSKESLETIDANDVGTTELIKSLQEAVKSKAESDAKLLDLQNKLAVSDAEVNKVEEELSRYKATVIKLSETAKESKKLKETISKLEEELQMTKRINESQKNRLRKIQESIRKSKQELQESVSKKDESLNILKREVITLKEDNTKSVEEIKKLTEGLEEIKKSSESQQQELTEKLSKSEKLVKGYKRIANDTVRRYIESKANMLGVSPNEIKNKLGETYTIDDVDKICEDLQAYTLNISKLPFNFDRKVKVKVTESKNDILNQDSGLDDEVDDALLTLANLK